MTATRLFVVRHGQTTNNRDGLISGYYEDPPLTEDGIAQAKATREKLSHIHFDDAYSSDLQRAVHTAAIIYGDDIRPLKQITELRERSFGSIEGLASTQLDSFRKLPYFKSLTEEERWKHKFAEDIESDHEVSIRFINALVSVAEDNAGKTILIASHGGTLRTMLISIGYATAPELPFGSIDNAAFVELNYTNGSFIVGHVGGVRKQLS